MLSYTDRKPNMMMIFSFTKIMMVLLLLLLLPDRLSGFLVVSTRISRPSSSSSTTKNGQGRRRIISPKNKANHPFAGIYASSNNKAREIIIPQKKSSNRRRRLSSIPLSASTTDNNNDDHTTSMTTTTTTNRFLNVTKTGYKLFGIASALCWIAISLVALSYHPDPKFADCTIRHNVLTMSQAFAFPLPVGWAVFSALSSSLSIFDAKKSKNDDDGNHDTSSLQSTTTTTTTTTTTSSSSSCFRRLNLGVATASLWLAASAAFAPCFAFGYDLYTFQLKAIATTVHLSTALFSLAVWKQSINRNLSSSTSSSSSKPVTYYLSRVIQGVVTSLWKLGPTDRRSNSRTTISTTADKNNLSGDHYDDDDDDDGSSSASAALYATCTTGLLWFTLLPIVSPYPLATIPTILGKRLSRPASAFTFLGAIASYCLKDAAGNDDYDDDDDNDLNSTTTTLQRGLAIGSACHLVLIFLKVIGVDGGGLIFPGRGLWEVYPAMIAVPFAAASSMIVHALVCFAAVVTN